MSGLVAVTLVLVAAVVEVAIVVEVAAALKAETVVAMEALVARGGFGASRVILHGVADRLLPTAMHLLRTLRQGDSKCRISPARPSAPVHSPLLAWLHPSRNISTTPCPCGT